ncbi:MAG TPA: di-heme oxidoredictase family protein [Oligoflexia bacterium]|nr:di-heme oxidoredictase family protein [Oligoflexia bacterium]HMP27846.1 di-heme oxidoredictase family protein [Oligoflexia bacterium]
MRFYIFLTANILLFLSTTRSFAQDISLLGGDLTTEFPGRNALQLPAPNVPDGERKTLQLTGFGDFHRIFTKSKGLGLRFVHRSCGSCHVENGRGPVKFPALNELGSTMVVFASRGKLKSNGVPRAVPVDGLRAGQFQEFSTNTTRRAFNLRLTWRSLRGRYPDGKRYNLRQPTVTFRIPNFNARLVKHSLRMTPMVIGPGLIDMIPDSSILSLADPNDLNGDGISGKPNFVIDLRTGQKRLGKFGFKATQPTVEQQSAAAFFGDMGVTTSLFVRPGKTPEVSDEILHRLTVYQQLGGVPKARRQDEPIIQQGKSLFQAVGCNSCHHMEFLTGDDPSAPELSNQLIHPFSDFLLHDMGAGLADKHAVFEATGREWRTTPLWGLGHVTQDKIKRNFLHDGRARTIEEAILWHGGEASASRAAFMALTAEERAALLEFLSAL